MRLGRRGFAGWLIFLSVSIAGARGGDWPQWGYDAGRGAASPEELPERLQLQWMRQLPEPAPAWPPSQPSLRFDVSYSPVAADGTLFVPSMVTDTVTAYDASTGEEKWRFYADGPVRFAPVADRGKVYFASDDGCLYCLNADRGTLCWRFCGAPYDRKVLGNERLTSTWPARGGPVLHGGIIYFTAGIWPFMGIFVHAVDAETGRAVWTNSGEGSAYITQPHNSPAFGGFAPCGYLAATEQGLVVPGGRTLPACYDLKTGRLRHFDFGDAKEGTSGLSQVSAHDRWFLQNGQMFAVGDGAPLLKTPCSIHDQQALYGISQNQVLAQAAQPREASAPSPPAQEQAAEKTQKKGKKNPKGSKGAAAGGSPLALQTLWQAPLPEDAPKRLFLKAGSQLVAGQAGQAAAIRVAPQRQRAELVWKVTFEGEPWTMLAADGRLFVVTTAGRIYCFAEQQAEAKTYPAPKRNDPEAVAISPTTVEILAQSGAKEGYGVIFGLSNPALAQGLLRASTLRLIAVDPDAKKVEAARRQMDEAGLCAARFTAHVGEPLSFALPPFLASLAVVEAPAAAGADRGVGLVQAVFRVLRPYGGVAVFEGLAADTLRQWVQEAGLTTARVEAGEAGCRLVRAGPLPGAADWTHQYADAANSVVSGDRLVKAPLGLLWFGGPSNDEVLPRHGHGPAPQVAAGRLVIEGADMLRALDVYTGRLLWQKALASLGKYYDNTNHQPGAGEIGSNYVTLPDGVYVVRGSEILELDAATGEQKKQFRLAAGPDGAAANFGFLAVCDNLLVATASPVTAGTAGSAKRAAKAQAAAPSPDKENPFAAAPYAASSRILAVFDRQSGKLLWQREAKYSFRHNGIAVGAKRLFSIDGLSNEMLAQWKRRGVETDPKKQPDYQPRLLALDAQTGRELWSTGEDVFGTFLNYSAEHDVLLQAGSYARDRAGDEAKTGMAAYRGADGTVLWKDLKLEHNGPCMLHHDTIITQNKAYSLLTGQPKLRKDPLTGGQMPWQFERNYGCNTAIASEHLLTFRSAAAGYYDLARDGGTGNLGGFKSGCTSNLVVADGVLNAPEYTRTCACRYQNQTSLALVHDPRVEMWTFNPFRWQGEPVRRLGINFGAPGDRVADDGTLWLDFPSQGGPSPDVPVEVEPSGVEYFRHHSALLRVGEQSPGLSWVAASGVRNVSSITLTLCRDASTPRPYTLRLHFAETEPLEPGQRVFNVTVQGRPAVQELDILRECGPWTALVKEFRGVPVADKLKVSFEPCKGSPQPPVLCGLEAVLEEP